MITSLASSHPAMELASSAAGPPGGGAAEDSKLRETFDTFVGETFFNQMLSSMRKTVGEPAYLHGGRAEEIFQGQLDQVFAQEMAERTAGQFTDPMFELFRLSRSG